MSQDQSTNQASHIEKFMITSTPHIRSDASIKNIMLDVCVALAPAIVAAGFYFGVRALVIVALSVLTCVATEYVFQKMTKQTVTIDDLSAVVTGLLLAMNLPSSVPFWIPVVGGVFAIGLVKQLFGGLGQNFMNPALAARAFLQTAYPSIMMNFTAPGRGFVAADAMTSPTVADAVTSPTPLTLLKMTDFMPNGDDYMAAFLGQIGGSLGETCAIALIFGGLYLIFRKIISWRIPVLYLATFAVLTFIFGRHGLMTGIPLYEVLTGGILLGAFFMATDYSTCPITASGQLVMGVACGVLTFVIRIFGGMAEGVCYSILIMNLVVPLIDRYMKPRVYGVQKGGGKA